MSQTILIVEDEKDLAATIEYNLEREGYLVKLAYDGETALKEIYSKPGPNLILLDLMLPDTSGLDICRQLKSDDSTRMIPVVMVTAKGEEVDRVVGFELGADDYVVKPFSVRELLLRIRALFMRLQPPEANEYLIRFGPLKIDVPGHKVWVNESEINLTALEFRLLETLYRRRGRVQTRETLLNDVWGIDVDVTSRTVDTHINRLRDKISSTGAFIETIRGVGYRFRRNPDLCED
jgi:two-component system phosphate regulon response regulator PhoB